MTQYLDPAVLDDLWDLEDPAGSAERLRAAMVVALYPAADELATQYARALSLAGRGDEADAVLGTVIGHDSVVRSRLLLERGRRLIARDQLAEAVPMLQRALQAAQDAERDDLIADVTAAFPTAR